VKNFENAIKLILQESSGFGYIKQTKKLFYPRKFNLSEEFVSAFKKEVSRLKTEGHNTRHILQKLNKALMFHS